MSACAPDRTDITAANKEFTGPYDVIAREMQPDGTVILRIRVQRVAAAEMVARNVAHNLAPKAPHGYRIEIIGPEDPATGTPRLTFP
jgi:hypothetical protein